MENVYAEGASEVVASLPSKNSAWRAYATEPQTDPAPLLPDATPVRLLGTVAGQNLNAALLHDLYRRLVLGRRFNEQAGMFARQGLLAVYPASTGQEACQIATATVLRATDWLFPTYRDTLAVVSRGVDPVEALALFRGDAHSGFNPYIHRIAPLSTPLGTHAPHAVGLAHAAQLRGEDVVALALIGDGATSEGDFHEALNFAGVFNAPVVFLVQNNGYAISVPFAKQSVAPTLAHKGVGYGIHSRLVDGNDAAAMYIVLGEAVEHARSGCGPVLVEAVTYRLDPHTNADDASRYRTIDEVDAWRQHDPVLLLEKHLRNTEILDDNGVREIAVAAEEFVSSIRKAWSAEPTPDPMSLFAHVYAEPTTQLREQFNMLRSELDTEAGMLAR
ncbi:MAG: thiamine pyrophosphate-dependent dehydrogenase E1 component subunit alpha [Pseudonocardiaceae bacterium]